MLTTRLKNQRLLSPTPRPLRPSADGAELVTWLGAVQAQDYTGAKWGLHLRGAGPLDADIDRAFDAGRILRTHVLRPTWHFVPPDDIRWMLSLTGPRIQAVNLGYGKRLGADAKTFARARTLVERALEGGRYLTRGELADVLRKDKAIGRDANGQLIGHLIAGAELEAAICSGPRRGRQFTYALIAERAPGARTLPREEALATLATRYFQSHGPATVRDFGWWSGLTMKDVRTAVAAAGVAVLEEPPGPDRSAGAHYLLPNYDESLIAYKDRGAVIDPSRVRNFGVFTSVEFPHQVILDGRVAGSWQRAITPTRLTVRVRLYQAATRSQESALRAQAERYRRFLGLTELEVPPFDIR